jgi:hypothetical protein
MDKFPSKSLNRKEMMNWRAKALAINRRQLRWLLDRLSLATPIYKTHAWISPPTLDLFSA